MTYGSNSVLCVQPALCMPVITVRQATSLSVQAHLSALPCVLQVDWKSEENRPVKPKLLGTQVYKEYDVKDILDYIDWNPFFQVGLVWSSVLHSSPPSTCNEPAQLAFGALQPNNSSHNTNDTIQLVVQTQNRPPKTLIRKLTC